MKLLFDHNLPPLLVSRLADLFPQSQHVFPLGLDQASDWEIRDFARSSFRLAQLPTKGEPAHAIDANGFVLWLSG